MIRRFSAVVPVKVTKDPGGHVQVRESGVALAGAAGTQTATVT